MEWGGGYSQSLAHSFSLRSLVEGSEPISEAEEFVEMNSLRQRGDKALKIKDFNGAIRYYNEVLEIDEQNPDVLLARATACIAMGDYMSAVQFSGLHRHIDWLQSSWFHFQRYWYPFYL